MSGRLSAQGVSDPDAAGLLDRVSFSADLVIYDLNATMGPILAWRVEALPKTVAVTDDPGGARVVLLYSETFFVGAASAAAGQLLEVISGGNFALPVTGNRAVDLLGLQRTFNAAAFPSGTYLWDTQRGITTYRVHYGGAWDGIASFSSDEMFDSGWEQDAVSVHANVKEVYDYYLNELNHRSYDNDPEGDGFNRIDVFLDYNGQWDNAEFTAYRDHGELKVGDIKQMESALDIAAHEYTHGVIAGIQWLTYEGESGALNEAYADILASLAEAKIEQNSRDDSDRWLHGEGPFGQPDRSLEDPSAYQSGSATGQYRHDYDSRYRGSDDKHGVHVNSTIFSHAFYRMVIDPPDSESRGSGRTAAVTDEQWAKVFYNSLYRLPSNANFVDARSAVISSAMAQGFTRPQIEAIQDAFDHVGIRATNYTYGVYKTTTLGTVPYDLAFGADKGRAYVVMQDNMIKVIDTAALSSSGGSVYEPTVSGHVFPQV